MKKELMAVLEVESRSDREQLLDKRLQEQIQALGMVINQKAHDSSRRIAERKNFGFVYSPGSLVMGHRDGREKQLETFLPANFTLVRSDHFSCDREQHRVLFSLDEWSGRGFLLNLFHEIGHANGKMEEEAPPAEILKTILKGLYRFLQGISLEKRQVEEEGKIKMRRTLTHVPIDDVVSALEIDRWGRYHAKVERAAWAYALKELRKLQREGYNVFAGFKDVEEIITYVDYCLFSYDIKLFLDKMKKGDWRSLVKQRAYFLNKSNKILRLLGAEDGHTG